jgi:translation initiation factor IF-2
VGNKRNGRHSLPARIYALAKELKLDSGELSDLCAKAGITGKGSALASLTDEEVVKLKRYMSGAGTKSAPSAPGSGNASTAERIESRFDENSTIRREDYVAPSAAVGKPQVISTTTPVEGKKTSSSTGSAKSSLRGTPAVKLAPLPPAEQPPAESAEAEEVVAQKPDMKLPADAMRPGASKPLSEHLRKHEKKKQGDASPPKNRANKEISDVATDRGRRRNRNPQDLERTERVVDSKSKDSKSKDSKSKDSKSKDSKSKDSKSKDSKSKDSALLGGREARQLNRKRTGRGRRGRDDERGSRRGPLRRRSGISTAAPRKGNLMLEMPCTVRSFSEAIGVPAANIQRQLMAMDQMCTINSELDVEAVEFLALELGVEIELKQPVSLEDELLQSIEDRVDDLEAILPRPPVVTFLGHVDHGKTSLLDAIIGIDVVSGESGGITQHIRAYDVERAGKKISFVDTPGHEAFTEMRARGANVTDIAVLVVAADDGVMPQTEEAISHARAADVPIVVALNKMDLPGIDENRVFQELAANELLPREWGGEIEVIRTSATTGEGLEDLLEMLLFIAEDQDYRANPNREAFGTCLEAQLHEGRGVISKLIVQNGTMRVGDCIVCGNAFGKVKAMYNTLHPSETLWEVGPSTPVDVTGLDTAPAAGERFYVLEDIAKAREIAAHRDHRTRTAGLSVPVHVTLEGLFDRLGQDEVQTLNLILRADVRGSIEAIQQELEKIDHPEVRFKILQATVGGITEADVHLADASDAIICGFNVVPDEGARILADQRGVQIRRYSIIYKLTDDLRAALEGMLKPEEREAEIGRALVQRIFKISRVGTIAGSRVLSGVVERNARARVIRNNTIVGDYSIAALRRIKDDVRDVREGLECGIKLGGFNDVKEGDLLEVYKIEEIARTLDDN